ncbi:unnamed protein product [Enterobius vermicularis]|uniref:Uncharacterized protein n=1 Tax=Enterobius vermicularis TaxID=51028 RepID=A0A3P6HHH3_ENTVE|nr:unnamed protein product [Enterobius vermicularis]
MKNYTCVYCHLFSSTFLFRRKRRTDLRKRSNELGGDIILNTDHHLNFDDVDANSKKNVIIYGTSLQNNDFFSRAVPYTSQSLRKTGSFDRPKFDRPLHQSSTTLRLHTRPDGYYAASRMYEEIPPRIPDIRQNFDDINILQLNQLDRDLILRESSRKPPPTCRPPPPPQGSPFSTGSSVNSIEHELQHIHSSPSPKREIKNRPGSETSPRQPPLAVFAHQNHAHSTMTYV